MPHIKDTQITDYRLVLTAAKTKGNAVVEIRISDLDGILADIEEARARIERRDDELDRLESENMRLRNRLEQANVDPDEAATG